MIDSKTPGIALLCDIEGTINQILRDDLNLTKMDSIGQHFSRIVDVSSVIKVENFLRDIRARRAAFNWEIHIKVGQDVVPVYFVGGLTDSQILLVGAPSNAEVTNKFYEEMMRVNSQQINDLRAALKEQNLIVHQQLKENERYKQFYEEFASVNNELVNMRRQLEKQNAKLSTQEIILQQSNDSLRRAQELARIGSWEWHVQSNHIEWSTQMISILGIQRGKLQAAAGIGLLTSRIHPDNQLNMMEAWQQALEKGTFTPQECYILCFDGDERIVHVEIDLTFRQGELIRAAGTVQDITERKRLEKQALELRMERERSQIAASFMENASHEFRTPLTIIQSSAYLLDRILEDDRARQHLAKINTQANSILRLVEDLMTIARLDQAGQTVQEKIHLNQIVQMAVESTQRASEKRDLKLQTAMEQDAPVILGDINELYLAVSKLIDNAIRYTADGGQITIRTRSKGSWVLLEIEDNGIGISEEDQERIFERFYRADKAHSTAGFGLGLAIARRIIERHGGIIKINSNLGEGTTARILLPTAR